jgi:peptidyl-prolyl cis-trans isomerase A (cyclophilin A)
MISMTIRRVAAASLVLTTLLALPALADKAALLEPAKLTEQAPDVYKVKMEASNGTFVIEVDRAWSPLGADRFFNLVKNGYFDENRFFRVVPDFVVQFGLNGDPDVTKAWREARIKDDAVTQSNYLGYVTFATAGPNTRTTQIFINLKNNGGLDRQGFSPFGKVISGMDIVQSIYAGYGQNPQQGRITQVGNVYLKSDFPELDYIKTATIVPASREAETRSFRRGKRCQAPERKFPKGETVPGTRAEVSEGGNGARHRSGSFRRGKRCQAPERKFPKGETVPGTGAEVCFAIAGLVAWRKLGAASGVYRDDERLAGPPIRPFRPGGRPRPAKRQGARPWKDESSCALVVWASAR